MQNKPSKSKVECEHDHTQSAKDAYGKMAIWCSNCGTRLSKNPQDDRPAPGTVGHRISLLEAVMFGQSKVKDFPSTLSGADGSGAASQPAQRKTGNAILDEAAEHEADLRHESLMADESEYGPRCNLPDDEGWRNV